MTAFYNLQTAIVNAVSEGKGSPALLIQMKKSKDIFRAHWEEYVLLLQRCHGYADDYLALCGFFSRHPPSQSVVPSAELLEMAKRLLSEIQILGEKHDKDAEEFRKCNSRIDFLFGRSSTAVIVKKKVRSVKGGKWLW